MSFDLGMELDVDAEVPDDDSRRHENALDLFWEGREVSFSQVADALGLSDGIWSDYYARPKWVKDTQRMVSDLAARGTYVRPEKGRFVFMTEIEAREWWFQKARRRASAALDRGSELISKLPASTETTDKLARLGAVRASFAFFDGRRKKIDFPT